MADGKWQTTFSAFCHLPSAICHLPSAICHLPSAMTGYRYTFELSGIYSYNCTVHIGMTGVVRVP